ncbi:MAG: glutamate--tRNA ligase, partial [Spirochaetaceae bacterium]|nr:glutamate--tRNA ligase [Spirochaetaceae bacterium]
MSIRCRYAPSPTGNQHIGGLRTALFNYLLARSPHGAAAGAPDGGERRFILRLEDTDRSRYDAAFVKDLYDTFDWIGFRWDEGPDSGGPAAPYVQSERFDLYAGFAAQLLESGAAYRCFCTAARLDAVRAERDAARARGEAGASESGYDRHCRALDAREAASRAASGEAYVIRLKIPLEETTRFTDALLGDISWKNSDISPDPVLIKSDGFPTYHLANIVDDHLMGITHVLRAQEWLSSTPLHVILYKAFGWQPPLFCHLPMVVGADGKKLSKRHGSTSVQEFRRAGYLPAALVNYVALLGASYQEGKDIYSLDELAALFSLAKLNKAPAVFDYKKLDWFNSQYIKAAPDEVLAQAVLPYMVEAGIFAGGEADGRQFALLCAAMPLIKERAVRLTEIPAKIAFVFNDPPVAPPE